MQVKAYVQLVGSLLSASMSHPNAQRSMGPPGLAGEMVRTMKEAGMISVLVRVLKLIDTSHPKVTLEL